MLDFVGKEILRAQIKMAGEVVIENEAQKTITVHKLDTVPYLSKQEHPACRAFHLAPRMPLASSLFEPLGTLDTSRRSDRRQLVNREVQHRWLARPRRQIRRKKPRTRD